MAFVDLPRRDARALAIFASYLLTCISLIVLICRDLYRQYHVRKPKEHPTNPRERLPRFAIMLFSILAAFCLYFTWYYMLSFFGHSYSTWAKQQSFAMSSSNDHQRGVKTWIIDKRIGDWLKDVQLFRDAWETVLEKPGCLFWAQPIFFITAAWSLYISDSARSRHIAYPWAYMLLGQIVAISFAQNLFFLAVLLHQPAHCSNKRSSSSLFDLMTHVMVPLLTIPSVAMIPTYTNGPYFLPLLMTPHLALMLPPLYASLSTSSVEDKYRTRAMYRILLAAAVILQVKVVADAANNEFSESFHHQKPGPDVLISYIPTLSRSLKADFFSHPAVSSVGFDVLLSLTTAGLWGLLNRVLTPPVTFHKKTR